MAKTEKGNGNGVFVTSTSIQHVIQERTRMLIAIGDKSNLGGGGGGEKKFFLKFFDLPQITFTGVPKKGIGFFLTLID